MAIAMECRAEDCGTCKYCIDNPRFGSPSENKQCCVVSCVATKMKQSSPNQASEMYQWSVQLRGHFVHFFQVKNF